MNRSALILGVIVWVVAAGPAIAQAASDLPSAAEAEWRAGNEAITATENLFNSGAARGPDSEACRQMNDVLLHHVRAASMAGAKTRVLAWGELDFNEQAAVQDRIKAIWPRNLKLRSVACAAAR